MNVLEYNNPPKLECICPKYMSQMFLFLVSPASVHGIQFPASSTRIGEKTKECQMESSTWCYFLLYINRERHEKNHFRIQNKLLSSLKLILYLLFVVLAMSSLTLAWMQYMLPTNCPVGKLSCRRTVLSENYTVIELSVNELSVGELSFGKVSMYWHVSLTYLQICQC